MLKREDPFTPQIKRGKKVKDYSTPLSKTPLRNMMSADNIGAADYTEAVASENIQQQRKRKKALLARSKSKSTDLLSPAPGISPRAVPITMSAHANVLRNSPSLPSLNARKLSVEQMTKSFDEWMRIAADNKINAKNTWNFALIDYFSELTFLREDNGETINFQKASCTLDGCVKIYSSRVDAVVDETGRLLSGLNERAKEEESNSSDEDEMGDEKKNDLVKKAKKMSKPPGDTLEKNPDNLSLKDKLELLEGATIDPLFKKTCADFDEASGGTLLFNLMIDRETRVIFDSNSAALPSTAGLDDRPDESLFDATLLVQQFGAALTSLSDKCLTSTTDNYSFLQQNADNFNIHDRLATSLEKLSVLEPEHLIETIDNPFGDTEMVQNDNNEYIDYEPYDNIEESEETTEYRPESAFSFLEAPGQMKSTWAGAEHWKIKRVNRLAAATARASQPARSKRIVEVDFFSVDTDLELLLTKGNNLSNGIGYGAAEIETTLPDDLHISSSEFTRLFLKPSCYFSQVKAVTSRQNNTRNSVENIQFIEQPIDIIVPDNEYVEDLQDALNDDSYDNVDLTQSLLSIEPSSQKALHVNYTRKAKRIDVRLLKESIWKTISQSAPSTTLSRIIHQLPIQYNQSAERSDLSVQYAFICLLHLANENKLLISEQSDGDLLVA